MDDYCSASDLYTFGLPHGALVNPGRLIAEVSTSANTLTLDVHGFALNDRVSFRADVGGSMPAPLVAGTLYYAIPLTESTFSVSATSGGAAIDITTAGQYVFASVPLSIAEAIAYGRELIHDMLPAHLVPIEAPIPPIIRMTNAELAIWKITTGRGTSKTLGEMVDTARKRLERWAKGIPLRGDNVPPPANTAVISTAPHNDSRGWNKWGGL